MPSKFFRDLSRPLQCFLLTCCLLSQAHLAGQTLIPWLGKDGQHYGFATEAGELVIQPVLLQPKAFPKQSAGLLFNESQWPEILFRNGQTFRLKGRGDHALLVAKNHSSYRNPKIDTLHHLSMIIETDSASLLDHRAGKVRTYLNCSRFTIPQGLVIGTTNEDFTTFKFVHGVLQVYKTPQHINFVDTSLNEVFPRDFAAGKVVDDQYFILAEGPGKYSVGTRTGKILFPFHWKSIYSGGKEGHFIVNHLLGFGARMEGNAGVINAKGELMLDTIYSEIKVVPGGELLVTRIRNEVALIDYQGRMVVPYSVQAIMPSHAEGMPLILYDFAHYNLIDHSGKKLLAEDAEAIRWVSDVGFSFFYAQYTSKCQVIDEKGQVVLTLNADEISLLNTSPVHFRTTWKAAGKIAHGIRDLSGKEVLPQFYDDIRLARVGFREFLDAYVLTKGNLNGLIDFQGKEILPLKFSKEEMELKLKDIAAQKFASLPEPEAKSNPIKAYLAAQKDKPSAKINPNKTITLIDGSTIPIPDSLKKMNHIWQIPTVEGYFLYFILGPIDRYSSRKIYNHEFKDILSPGFMYYENPKWAHESFIEETELLAVCKPGKTLETVVGKQPEEFGDDSWCGVINSLGQLVMPPKQGVRFIPLSRHMIAEVPFSFVFSPYDCQDIAYKIHCIGSKDKKVVEVNFHGRRHLSHAHQSIVFGRCDKGKKNKIGAYFNALGEQLTPFNVTNGPDRLYFRNLLTLQREDGTTHQVLMDSLGNILRDLGELMANGYHSPFISYSGYKQKRLDYFVVSEPSKNAQGTAVRPFPLQNIMDSMGNLILPRMYRNLSIVEPGKLLIAENENDHSLLMNWQGKVLYEGGSKSNLKFFRLPDGNGLAGGTNGMALLSPDYQVLKEYPLCFHSTVSEPGLEGAYFLARSSPYSNVFWVRISDGKEYREK